METIASNYAEFETSQPEIKYFPTFYQSTNDICFHFHSLSVYLIHAINVIPLSIVDYPLREIKFPNS